MTKLSKRALLLSSIVGTLALTSCNSEYFLGNPNCVISKNYDCITYLNNRYIPLNTKQLSFQIYESLICEAQVEGVKYKILFSDSIYSIKSCSNADLIYLQTDYDDAPSDIYCLEEKIDDYEKMIANFQPKNYFYEVVDRDWNYTDVPLDTQILTHITEKDLSPHKENLSLTRKKKDDEYITVKSYDDNQIFYQVHGYLLKQDDKYYWYDLEENTYVFPLEDYPLLNTYFSYMPQ